MPLAQQKSHSPTLPPAVCWWINLSSPLQSSSVSLKAPCLLSFSGRLAWRTSALLLENSSLKWRGCTVALVCHPKLVANTNSNVPAGCWVFGEFTGVTGSQQLCNAKSWSRNVKIEGTIWSDFSLRVKSPFVFVCVFGWHIKATVHCQVASNSFIIIWFRMAKAGLSGRSAVLIWNIISDHINFMWKMSSVRRIKRENWPDFHDSVKGLLRCRNHGKVCHRMDLGYHMFTTSEDRNL